MAKQKTKNKAVLLLIILIAVIFIVSLVLDRAGVWDKIMQSENIVSEKTTATSVVSNNDENTLTAYFIDVGQGDCTLFVSGDESMLIDCGEAEYAPLVTKKIKSLGITDIDYIVPTHAHSDHMGGMSEIINEFTVKNIIMSEPSDKSATSTVYEKFLDAADTSGAAIIKAEPEYTFSLGSASCEILAPFSVSEKEENDNSIVMYISFGETSFLMTGDAETPVEKEIISHYPNLHADILKVGHHGSKTSTSENFLKLIRPKTAIISVGENNSYGHPAEKTILNLDDFGVKYYRTDKCGTVTVNCDGASYIIDTEI